MYLPYSNISEILFTSALPSPCLDTDIFHFTSHKSFSHSHWTLHLNLLKLQHSEILTAQFSSSVPTSVTSSLAVKSTDPCSDVIILVFSRFRFDFLQRIRCWFQFFLSGNSTGGSAMQCQYRRQL